MRTRPDLGAGRERGPHEGPRRGSTGWVAGAVVVAALAGCVTTIVEAEKTASPPLGLGSLVIPLGPGGGLPVAADQYYSSVIQQMQEALAERDLEGLRGLLAAHDRRDAPAWASERMGYYRDAALGVELERHLQQHARLEIQGVAGLGDTVECMLRCPPMPGREVRLRVSDAGGVKLLVQVRILDTDALGSNGERSTSQVLDLPKTSEGGDLAVPFHLALAAGPAVVRHFHVRFELLPGSVTIDGRPVPMQRALLTEVREDLYPQGTEPIRAKPLLTLRRALALGDEAHFPHMFLAARFMPASDRATASELLIDRVRLGRDRQARAAMAALRELTGEKLTVEDRDGWLKWWQKQVPARR